MRLLYIFLLFFHFSNLIASSDNEISEEEILERTEYSKSYPVWLHISCSFDEYPKPIHECFRGLIDSEIYINTPSQRYSFSYSDLLNESIDYIDDAYFFDNFELYLDMPHNSSFSTYVPMFDLEVAVFDQISYEIIEIFQTFPPDGLSIIYSSPSK